MRSYPLFSAGELFFLLVTETANLNANSSSSKWPVMTGIVYKNVVNAMLGTRDISNRPRNMTIDATVTKHGMM